VRPSNLSQKVTYVVRKDDKSEFQGDLSELKAWLAEKRITTSDEVRRLGYVVLEGDDLWTRVGDRSELGFDLPQERARLNRLQAARWASILLFGSLSLALVIVLVVTQVLPRYDSIVAVRDAELRYNGEVDKLTHEHESKITGLNDVITKLEQQKKALSEANINLSSDLSKSEKARAEDSKEIQNLKVIADNMRLSNEKMKSSIDELKQQLEAYQACLADERKELARAKQKISTLESAPYVFEGVSYALKTRDDVRRADRLKKEWLSSLLQVKNYEERVSAAQERVSNLRARLSSAYTYTDTEIYQGLYRDANQDLINRNDELSLAKAACDKQYSDLVSFLKENSY
jgi:hypothetical protein